MTPPRVVGQESSPRIQRTLSPGQRAEASSPSRTQVAQDRSVVACPSLPNRRPSREGLEPQSDVGGSAAITPINTMTAPTTKRPLPPLPPKPVSISRTNHPNIQGTTHPAPQPTDQTNGPSAQASDEPTHSETANRETNSAPKKEYSSMDDLLRSETYNPPLTTTSHQAQPLPQTQPHRNPLLVRANVRMPARSSPSGNESCAGCGKVVYFAEGVRPLISRLPRQRYD